jgi:hypothetical protein
MYLDNTKIYITKLTDNEFHFSYEFIERKDQIQNLKEFRYEGVLYEIKKIVEAFDIVGYHSFLVYAKPQPQEAD